VDGLLSIHARFGRYSGHALYRLVGTSPQVVVARVAGAVLDFIQNVQNEGQAVEAFVDDQ